MTSPAVDRNRLPEPILDDEPDLVELYWTAWQLAAEHVVTKDGIAQSPYMDEGFDPDVIWIWDTCFMAHFAKYAPDLFPGVESLDNFYGPIYDGAPSALKIQHPDNPPLFAWTELEYVRHTGDLERVERILGAGYLQKHFAFFDSVAPGTTFDFSVVPTTIERIERGYRWSGVCSGMDNTPRAPVQGRGGTSGPILWLDAAAQQALTAGCIADLARLVGDGGLADEYDDRHAGLAGLVQDFWDEADGIFYDRFDTAPFDFHRVRTPATYWPLLAGVCTDAQAATLADLLTDPSCLGGPVPWPSVARDDPTFSGTGHYWRGGVWVPTAYMSARALADHGFGELARKSSHALISHMARTYRDYEPASIWEAYAPIRATPSTGKDDQYIVRPDFCGWSALAPISMLIEHVLGFRVDATAHTVNWQPGGAGRQGIRRLRCGSVTLSAIADADTATVETDGAVTMVIAGRPHSLEAGTHTFEL